MRSLRLRPLVSRLLIYTHRWFGILLGALFAGWFVSGVVLMYAGMPRLEAAERRARRPVLDFSHATVAPSEVARAAGADPQGPGSRGARTRTRAETHGCLEPVPTR